MSWGEDIYMPHVTKTWYYSVIGFDVENNRHYWHDAGWGTKIPGIDRVRTRDDGPLVGHVFSSVRVER